MPSIPPLLLELRRDELTQLVDALELQVDSRRSKQPLQEALAQVRPKRLLESLAALPRDRLKSLCGNLGVDQSGRTKIALAERLVKAMKESAPKGRAASSVQAMAPSKALAAPKTAKASNKGKQANLHFDDSETLSLAQLESHLWEAANILRGSPVDRTDWKSYILPLLFFKRICDVWDEEHSAMLEEYGEDFPDEHRFAIPEGNHWSDVRAAPKNVGTTLANAMRSVEAANQKHLYGVFGDAQWTNKDRLPDELLKDLIEHFSALSLGNRSVTNDVMGDAYEYLIKKFADATNKKAGEFYTPRSVVRLIVDILDPKEGETVYDPACGTGGMLLAAVEHVRDQGGDPRTFFGKLHGQEKNLTTASVARMNLFLHGIEDFVVERGDTLRNPIFTDASTGGLGTFDVVIANPPFSLEQWGREIWETDPWGRAFAGIPSDRNADMAWVQHMVQSMAHTSGRMGLVLSQGALDRKGVEKSIRQHLLEQDLVETVVGLAPGLFYGTGLAACLLILRQKKPPVRKGKVLIVDASGVFRRGRAQNFMDRKHGSKILGWVQGFSDIEDRARVVELSEIEKEDWTLNISRYVLPPIGADIPPLPDAIAAFNDALTRCRETENHLGTVMLEGGWLK